jgi:phospholipase/carboxylesterase
MGMREGEPIAASLPHRVLLPKSGGRSFPTIIAIHGRGADENDLIPLVSALKLPDTLVITPRAPFAFPYGGFAWYSIADEGVPDPETFGTSLQLLRKFIEEVKEGYPVDPRRMLLLGFSQGSMMAYGTGLPVHLNFLGIAALSGYLPRQSSLPLPIGNLSGFPIFISHGVADPIIPVRFGKEAAELLAKAGAVVEYHEYPIGHEVSLEVLNDLAPWMGKRLSRG